MPWPSYMRDLTELIEEPECLVTLSSPSRARKGSPGANETTDASTDAYKKLIDHSVSPSVIGQLSASTLEAMQLLGDWIENTEQTIVAPLPSRLDLSSDISQLCVTEYTIVGNRPNVKLKEIVEEEPKKEPKEKPKGEAISTPTTNIISQLPPHLGAPAPHFPHFSNARRLTSSSKASQESTDTTNSLHPLSLLTSPTTNTIIMPNPMEAPNLNTSTMVADPDPMDISPPPEPKESTPFISPVTAILLQSMSTEGEIDMGLESALKYSPGTTLVTRTTEDVIADLKRLRPIPQFDPSKRRRSADTEVSAFSHAASAGIGDESLVSLEPHEQETYDDEEENIVGPVTKSRKVTERRRRQNAIADNHVRNRTLELIKKGSVVRPEDEANQSTRWLVNQSENRVIISTPREYQTELFERAKEKNIIAVLDTGSGKTLIAVLLLRHIFSEELEDRAIGKPKRISFFLVDSVTLVFQQHAVLKANLDQPMDMFCGDMGCDLWSKSKWAKHFNDNMVIVCTAEVLRQCLHHSFIAIDQINLLIFDEAHHAKKDHTYARIIKDFYAQAPPGSLVPKIFGMTASPVDARVDVQKAARELEGLLHAQICTTSDPELMRQSMATKLELIARYDQLGPKFETPLYAQMRERFEKNPVLRKPLLYAFEATRELGSWCADQVWPFCLSEEETKKLQANTERGYHAKKFHDSIAVLEKHKSLLDEAREIVKSHSFEAPDFNVIDAEGLSYKSKNLSPKVVVLIRHLKERFQRPTDDKCIIFVKQRYTARLLARLLSHPDIGTPYLKVGTLVGTRTGDAGDLNISFHQQVRTMMDFRKEKLNCLVATSVAEEGLDIPDCNLVIRFDLYTTLIQYIQSRGRARLNNSRYIHMIEDGNQQHLNIVLEVRRNENVLKRFCEALPDDRKLTGNDYNMEYFLSKERSHRVFTVKSTGAKLNYKMALMVLSNFVDSLPQSQDGNPQAEYVMIVKGKQFECEVILPESSPVRGAVGQPHTTKQVAKCSAAFQACLELVKGKYLDDHLLPTFTKQLPAMRNAVLAVDSKKRAKYDMKTKPKIWSVGGVPELLYITVLKLDDLGCLERSSQPIALLTRSKLVQLPSFVLHFGGKHSSVNCSPLDSPLSVSLEVMSRINKFTLSLFEDIFSKEYEPDLSKMPYFIVPILPTGNIHKLADPCSLVDWEILKSVEEYQNKWAGNIWDNKSWKTEADDFFTDRYVTDPYDGSRKLFIVGRAPHLKPLDPLPDDCAPRSGARKNNDNIMEYSCSLWAKSRQGRKLDPDQRVYEARLVSLRRNLLDEFDITGAESSMRCYVCLEMLKISCLPATVVTMTYLFPAIIHRIESYLIALEATELLHLNIRPDLALEACTKDSDNSGDHDSEKINFQRGMGNNYERLEFLGDCFLKMATSISLYGLHPSSDEYQYHVDRMLLICNKNLCNNAIKLKLFEYIRSQSFNRRAWYPEGLVLKRGKRVAAPNSHDLGDKSIADVCEAMIGAALLAHHETKNMDNAVRAVTELVCSENHNVTTWSDYYKLYEMPKYQTMVSTAMQKNLAIQIEKKHAYRFKWPRVLRSAFIHPSYPYSYEKVPSYQRLEFLGDSLLDMACVNFLYHKFPGKDPQWLTEHKMAMASNQFLGALCVSLEFHTHLLVLNGQFQNQIKNYVEEIQEARRQAELDAVRTGKLASECATDYWTSVRQPPKCLPDIVEAYVGAVFVDSEYDYSEVERFFDEHIKWYFNDMSVYDSYASKNPATFLSSFLQRDMGCSYWTIHPSEIKSIDGSKPTVLAMVIIHGEVVSEHEAESSKYARAGAAKKALEVLKGLPLMEFKEKFNCGCQPIEDVEVAKEIGEMHGTAV